jgi:hypothetical protein
LLNVFRPYRLSGARMSTRPSCSYSLASATSSLYF